MLGVEKELKIVSNSISEKDQESLWFNVIGKKLESLFFEKQLKFLIDSYFLMVKNSSNKINENGPFLSTLCCYTSLCLSGITHEEKYYFVFTFLISYRGCFIELFFQLESSFQIDLLKYYSHLIGYASSYGILDQLITAFRNSISQINSANFVRPIKFLALLKHIKLIFSSKCSDGKTFAFHVLEFLFIYNLKFWKLLKSEEFNINTDEPIAPNLLNSNVIFAIFKNSALLANSNVIFVLHFSLQLIQAERYLSFQVWCNPGWWRTAIWASVHITGNYFNGIILGRKFLRFLDEIRIELKILINLYNILFLMFKPLLVRYAYHCNFKIGFQIVQKYYLFRIFWCYQTPSIWANFRKIFDFNFFCRNSSNRRFFSYLQFFCFFKLI